MSTVPAVSEREVLRFGSDAVGTKVALFFSDDCTEETWLQIGQRVMGLGVSAKWWIGDWLAHGEWNYGERTKAVRAELERDYADVKNYAYTSNNVPKEIRDPLLSWTHHHAIAKLASAELQERWLELAGENGWTAKELRVALQLAEKKEWSIGDVRDAIEELPSGRTLFDEYAEPAGSESHSDTPSQPDVFGHEPEPSETTGRQQGPPLERALTADCVVKVLVRAEHAAAFSDWLPCQAIRLRQEDDGYVLEVAEAA